MKPLTSTHTSQSVETGLKQHGIRQVVGVEEAHLALGGKVRANGQRCVHIELELRYPHTANANARDFSPRAGGSMLEYATDRIGPHAARQSNERVFASPPHRNRSPSHLRKQPHDYPPPARPHPPPPYQPQAQAVHNLRPYRTVPECQTVHTRTSPIRTRPMHPRRGGGEVEWNPSTEPQPKTTTHE